MSLKGKKGLTLVEMVISVTLLSLIILTTLSLLNFGQKTFSSTDSDGQLQSDAQNIITSISRLIRESSNIIIISPIHIDLDNQSIVNRENSLNIETSSGSIIRTLTDKIDSVYFTSTTGGINMNITLSSGSRSYEVKTTIYKRTP